MSTKSSHSTSLVHRSDGRQPPVARTPPRAPVRAMQVLESLAQARGPLSLATLSATLEVPKTSAMHLLRSLEQAGYVTRTQGGFELGGGSYRLAARIGTADDFEQATRDVLRGLLEQTQETVLLGTFSEDGNSAVYAMRMPSPQAVRFAPEVGEQRPLYASGVGKVLLAFAPDAFLQEYLRRTKLRPITAKTVTNRTALQNQLAQVRAEGMAVSIDEMAEGGSALAAPIYDAQERVRFALLLAAPTSRLLARQSQLASLLQDAAARLSATRGRAQP
jgi:DNA-binding IclR family transcriptional regulator